MTKEEQVVVVDMILSTVRQIHNAAVLIVLGGADTAVTL